MDDTLTIDRIMAKISKRKKDVVCIHFPRAKLCGKSWIRRKALRYEKKKKKCVNPYGRCVKTLMIIQLVQAIMITVVIYAYNEHNEISQGIYIILMNVVLHSIQNVCWKKMCV